MENTFESEPEPRCASDYADMEYPSSPVPRERPRGRRRRRSSSADAIPLLDGPLPGLEDYDLPLRSIEAASSTLTPGRFLSMSPDGDLYEPDTECWERFRDQPASHALMCNHEVETLVIRPCGSNCRPSSTADSKPKGDPILCPHWYCVERRRVRAFAPVFIAPKRKAPMRSSRSRAASGARLKHEVDDSDGTFDTDRHNRPGVKRRKLPTERDYSTERSSPASEPTEPIDDEETLIRLNQDIAQEPTLQSLVRSQGERGLRSLSTLHPGFALRTERQTNSKASAIQRELGKLHTDGTPSLALKLPRKQKVEDDPNFNRPDSPFSESKGKPWSYARAPKPGKTALRNEQAGMFSMPATTHAKMVEEESGMTVDQDESVAEGLVRTTTNHSDEEDDEAAAKEDGDEERFCICHCEADDKLEQCKECHALYHAACLGKKSPFRCPDCDVRRTNQQLVAQRLLGREPRPLARIRAEAREARVSKRRLYKQQEQKYGSTRRTVERRVQANQSRSAKKVQSKATLHAPPLPSERFKLTPRRSERVSSKSEGGK